MSFYDNTCGGFILGGIADCHPVTWLENELFFKCFYVFCLHLFYKKILWWLLPQCVFLRKFINKGRVSLWQRLVNFLHSLRLKLKLFAFVWQCRCSYFFITNWFISSRYCSLTFCLLSFINLRTIFVRGCGVKHCEIVL